MENDLLKLNQYVGQRFNPFVFEEIKALYPNHKIKLWLPCDTIKMSLDDIQDDRLCIATDGRGTIITIWVG